ESAPVFLPRYGSWLLHMCSFPEHLPCQDMDPPLGQIRRKGAKQGQAGYFFSLCVFLKKRRRAAAHRLPFTRLWVNSLRENLRQVNKTCFFSCPNQCFKR